VTLIRVDQARAALISNIESQTDVMALLDDTNEVREVSWKGTAFSYPNYRVRINRIAPFQDCYQELEASIFCYSEEASSQEAEEMAGTLANAYHDISFTQGSIKFTHVQVNLIPAIQEDERTWRSEVILESVVK
jgi:hypothetical protein